MAEPPADTPEPVQLATGEPWDGDLTPAQIKRQLAYAERVQAVIGSAIATHPEREAWFSEGEALRDVLLGLEPGFAQLWHAGLVEDMGPTYRGMLSALLGINIPVVQDGKVVGTVISPVTLKRLGPEPPARARDLADRVLAAIDQPNDKWRRYLVLGLLIEPTLSDWTRPFAPSLEPGDPDDPEWRRKLGLPDGTPQSIGRGGVQALSALQRRYGVTDRTPRRQPSQREPTRVRKDFIDYVSDRRAKGVSVQVIAEDAEAARLYRAWKPSAELLTEKIVRRALERSKKSR